MCPEVVRLVTDALASVSRVRDVHGHITVAARAFGILRNVLFRAGPRLQLQQLVGDGAALPADLLRQMPSVVE